MGRVPCDGTADRPEPDRSGGSAGRPHGDDLREPTGDVPVRPGDHGRRGREHPGVRGLSRATDRLCPGGLGGSGPLGPILIIIPLQLFIFSFW